MSSPGICGISGSRLCCRVSAAERSARNSRTLSSASPARRPRCAAVTTASAVNPSTCARGPARRARGRAPAAGTTIALPEAEPAQQVELRGRGPARAGRRCRSRTASRRSPGPLVSASVTLGARESQLTSSFGQRARRLAGRAGRRRPGGRGRTGRGRRSPRRSPRWPARGSAMSPRASTASSYSRCWASSSLIRASRSSRAVAWCGHVDLEVARALGLHAVGDVDLDPDVVGDPPGLVDDRADHHLVPERRAVAPVVADDRGDRAAARPARSGCARRRWGRCPRPAGTGSCGRGRPRRG